MRLTGAHSPVRALQRALILFLEVMFMDWTVLMQVVSSIGFPAAICFLMWKYMTDTTEELRKAVSDNTVAVAKMTQLLEVITRDDE